MEGRIYTSPRFIPGNSINMDSQMSSKNVNYIIHWYFCNLHWIVTWMEYVHFNFNLYFHNSLYVCLNTSDSFYSFMLMYGKPKKQLLYALFWKMTGSNLCISNLRLNCLFNVNILKKCSSLIPPWERGMNFLYLSIAL
jgi:hypothetical protein